MTLTTPAQERSPRCSGPHPPWARCHRPGAGHSAPRSWPGTSTHSARWRGPLCPRACAAREGPGRARRTRPEAPVEPRLPCQRWGVGAAGPAASGGGARQPVSRVQRVAPQRAQTPHQPGVRDGDGPGVPWAEAHATLRPQQGAWSPTAWAMGRGGLLGVAVGPRPQERAARRAGQSAPPGAPALAHGWVAGLPRGPAARRGGGSVHGVGGRAAARPRPGSWRPPPCPRRRASRCVPTRASGWRSAGGWGAAAPAAASRHDACARAVRRSRRPAWYGGMARGAAWARPGGVARGVAPGTASVTAAGGGAWCASPPW